MIRIGLILCVCASVLAKNADEKVVLVSPVLAPARGARAQGQDTAKDFPVLMVLATNETHGPEESKVHDGRPVYVKKLRETKSLIKRLRRLSATTTTKLPMFQNRH